MSSVECEFLVKLRHPYGEYEKLNRAIRGRQSAPQVSTDPEEIARAKEQELKFRVAINRLMDRLRAVEVNFCR
jgi:hypothetical protein